MSTQPNGAQHATVREEVRSRIATGNARPILAEIRTALERFIASGQTTTIDLGAIPFGPGDERLLDEVLGAGEVRATIEALGQSIVQETGFPGVWRVDHLDTNGDTLSRFVEINDIPEILKSQPGDAAAGLARLASRLDELFGQTR